MSEEITAERVQELVTRAPYHKWLGLRVLALHDDGIELGADWAMVRKLGRGVPTIDLRVDYHSPAMPGDLVIRGKVVRLGSQVSTAEAHVYDAQNKLVASGRGTYFTAPPPPKA
jgi:acyl-CoA thioesterase FadM